MTPFWAVLRTQMRREPIAAQAVLERHRTYLPLLPPARPSRPEQPLFPGYIFASVQTGSDDLLRIRSAPGIAYVLPPAGPPALLADAIVHQIRTRLAMSSRRARSSPAPARRSGDDRLRPAALARRTVRSPPQLSGPRSHPA